MNLKGMKLITHNAQFEHKWFIKNNIQADIVHDTKLLAHLFDERLPLGLEDLCLYFGIDKSYKCGDEIVNLTGKELYDRNTRDAYNTFKLFQILYPKLSSQEKEVYHKVLIPATKSIAKLELAGMKVDLKVLEATRKQIEDKTSDIRLQEDEHITEFNAASQKVFNINSSLHKKLLIYDVLGYPIIQRSKRTGEPTTQADILEALQLIKHKQEKHGESIENCSKCKKLTLSKIINTSKYTGWIENFLNPIQNALVGDMIYTNLWLGETSTGRLKSSKPNLQNCVKNFPRQIFISRYPEGVLSEFDYSGIEYRLMASLAKDAIAISAIKSGDPHIDTARLIFNKKEISKEERDIGKTFNYGLIYGAGAYRLSILTGLHRQEISKMLSRYWGQHNCIQTYFHDWIDNDLIYSPTGMKRHWTKETEAKNFPIQNSAFILMLQGLNRAVEFVEKTGQGVTCLTVHDSIVIDWKSEKAALKYSPEIKGLMCQHEWDWIKTDINADVKIGKDWYNMVEMK